jgi:hypothetical protein
MQGDHNTDLGLANRAVTVKRRQQACSMVLFYRARPHVVSTADRKLA